MSGIEGAFRSTCELALKCMRDNRDLIISVLESLLYDPLMDWRTSYTEGSMRESDVFVRILNTGRHTELSVQGQVDNVIRDATDATNLARMYIGWMPFF